MPRTLVDPLPGYKPEQKWLQPREHACVVRDARQWAYEASFDNATHAEGRHYRQGKVREGRLVFFVEGRESERSRAKASRSKAVGPASEASGPGLVLSDFLETHQVREGGEVGRVLNEAMAKRRGEQGITPKQRAYIRHLGWVLRPFQERLSFWTITLPTQAMVELQAAERGWERFSQKVHKELTRKLKQAGAIPWWLSVTEIQLKRSYREGGSRPHLHIVFVGRPPRKRNKKTKEMAKGGWYLSREVLDGIIATALADVIGRFDFSLSAAGNVKQVEKDVFSYLQKYMSKGCEDVAHWNDLERSKGLHVARWWHRSDCLYRRGEAHSPRLHGDFAWYARGEAHVLEALGLVRVREVEQDGFKPGGIAIEALRRDGLRIAYWMWKSLAVMDVERLSPYVPEPLPIEQWGHWILEKGDTSLSRHVAINNRFDVWPTGIRVVPATNLEADNIANLGGDRISSPVTDVVKKGLERLYRDVHVAEPVFLASGVLREQHQIELPLIGLSAGSAWDVGDNDSWDPFWDDPGWRGGPPRRVTD